MRVHKKSQVNPPNPTSAAKVVIVQDALTVPADGLAQKVLACAPGSKITITNLPSGAKVRVEGSAGGLKLKRDRGSGSVDVTVGPRETWAGSLVPKTLNITTADDQPFAKFRVALAAGQEGAPVRRAEDLPFAKLHLAPLAVYRSTADVYIGGSPSQPLVGNAGSIVVDGDAPARAARRSLAG